MRASLCLALCGAIAAGCSGDPASPVVPPVPPLVRAVYVLNEGNFGDPAGARLSLYDITRDSVFRDVFESANGGRHLGSLGDDLALHRGRAYVLMSGSENLTVLDLATHREERTAAFPGDTPHDIVIDSTRGKIYLTRLFKGSLLVLDLATLSIRDSVRVGNNPQGMVLLGERLFVCNSGYGTDRRVSVVDVRADTLLATITVHDGPSAASPASDGRLWIACTGNASGTPPTKGRLVAVDPVTLAVVDSVLFTENLWGSIVAGESGTLYVLGVDGGSFYGGPVHRIRLSPRGISAGFIPGTFYALAYDEVGGEVYAASAYDFSRSGDVAVFGPDGVLRRRFGAQLGPGVIRFRRSAAASY